MSIPHHAEQPVPARQGSRFEELILETSMRQAMQVVDQKLTSSASGEENENNLFMVNRVLGPLEVVLPDIPNCVSSEFCQTVTQSVRCAPSRLFGPRYM